MAGNRGAALFVALALVAGAQEKRESTPVDLLSLIDPDRDAVAGTWKLSPKGLVSPGRSFMRLALPYVPPEEYDLTVVAERHGESNSLNLGLAVGEVQFMVILDAWVNSEFVSGLDLLDGRAFMGNETTVKGALFTQGKPSTVVCSVRKDRLAVTVDGKKIIDWKADYRRLSLYTGWTVPRKDCLLLGSWTSVVRVEKLGLAEISGRGRLLREGTARPAPLAGLSEAEVRVRVGALLDRMNSRAYKERQAAQDEIESFPVRWIPAIQELAREKGSAEVRARVGTLALPAPWPRILRGSIREAQRTVLEIARPGPGRQGVIEGALQAFLEIPPEEAAAALEGFLEDSDPGVREFALSGLAVFPGRNVAKTAGFLEKAETAARAADALLAAGDASVAPKALEVFRSGQSPQAEQAARVLMHLDPGRGVEAALEALANRPGPVAHAAIRILEKAGDEKALIRKLEEGRTWSGPAVQSLARIGGEKAIAAIRMSLKRETDAVLRDAALVALRDPEWAREELAKVRAEDRDLPDSVVAGGASLREEARRRAREPGLKTGALMKILPLLGAAGNLEDAPFLLDKLADPRLAEAASEALDRIGEPAHAKPLLAAWKLSKADLRLGAAGGDEEDLLEVLADPAGYGGKWKTALEIAGRRPSPRMREVLLRGLAEGGDDWRSVRLEALHVLAGLVRKEDAPAIGKVRASQDPLLRDYGLLLALRAGDAEVAPLLAASLAAGQRPRLFPRPWGSELLQLMDWAAPAGKTWDEAVLSEWRRSRGWDEAVVWLAARGEKEAVDAARERLDLVPEPLRRYLDAGRAARGDAGALRAILERAAHRMALAPEEEAAFAAGADAEARGRALSLARLSARTLLHPAVRLAALAPDPRGVTLYRQILVQHEGVRIGTPGSEGVPVLCIRALGRLKAREASGDLRALLRSGEPGERAAAARALMEMGEVVAAIPFLVRLLDDPSPLRPAAAGRIERVWHAAIEALESLGQVDTAGSCVADRRFFLRSLYAGYK